jgi:hypothetical protein
MTYSCICAGLQSEHPAAIFAPPTEFWKLDNLIDWNGELRYQNLMDPLTGRIVERLIVCAGGIVFGYLGYRLLIFGAEKGSSSLKAESKFFKLVFLGPHRAYFLCWLALLF